MRKPTAPADAQRRAQLEGELRRDREARLQSYRERALKLFPHVCARCGRAFDGKRLRELTVHHRDHNHENNPPDGRNWELLCLYCHDHEHEKYKTAGFYEATGEQEKTGTFQAFADLDKLLGNPDKAE